MYIQQLDHATSLADCSSGSSSDCGSDSDSDSDLDLSSPLDVRALDVVQLRSSYQRAMRMQKPTATQMEGEREKGNVQAMYNLIDR